MTETELADLALRTQRNILWGQKAALLAAFPSEKQFWLDAIAATERRIDTLTGGRIDTLTGHEERQLTLALAS